MIDGNVAQAGLVWMTEDFQVGLEEVYWKNSRTSTILKFPQT
jgi:hypothetical protein